MTKNKFLQEVNIRETILEVVEAGRQGAKGVGVPDGGTTGQHLIKKSDNDYDTEWSDVSSENDVIPVRGGAVPLVYDSSVNYIKDDRVSYQEKEYRCIEDTTGVFNPDNWNEVSTQSNESRISVIEETLTGRVVNEYEFTETTSGDWTVTNAGQTLEDFNSPSIEFFMNGVKLRKNGQITWISDSEVITTVIGVFNEDFLTIRVTSSTSVIQAPTENEYTQNVPAGGIWLVNGIGNSESEFNSPKIQIYYNGVKLRKGSQAIWESPTQLRINRLGVSNEDYLTIRNEP